MRRFNFDKSKHFFNKETNTISVKETDIPPFDTSYEIVSPSGEVKRFDLKESTGSEWDPNTKWIYKADNGITLEVSQDAVITKLRAAAYLQHKARY